MANALSLTPELVASVDRTAPEVGQEAGQTPLADEEFRRLAHGIVREAGNTLHVFAYGSLIWKSQAGFTPIGMARAHGWRWSFSINLTTWRGTPDQPGLLLALDYGGSCGGILLRADDGIGPDRVEELLRRDIDYAEISCLRHLNERIQTWPSMIN